MWHAVLFHMAKGLGVGRPGPGLVVAGPDTFDLDPRSMF